MINKLCDIADIFLGHSFREKLENSVDSNTFVIQPRDIKTDTSIDYNGLIKVSLSTGGKSMLKRKDVLITNRGRFTSSIFCNKDSAQYLCTSGVFVIRVSSHQFDPEYVSLYLNSKDGQKQILNLLETTTIPFINKSNISNVTIPSLTLKEQYDVVEKFNDFKDYFILTKKKMATEQQIINKYIDITIRKGAK